LLAEIWQNSSGKKSSSSKRLINKIPILSLYYFSDLRIKSICKMRYTLLISAHLWHREEISAVHLWHREEMCWEEIEQRKKAAAINIIIKIILIYFKYMHIQQNGT
jgi:hypothetical protein